MTRSGLVLARTRKTAAWAVVSLLVLAGCQHTRIDLARTGTTVVPQDERFVFGRIVQIENGKPVKWGVNQQLTGCTVSVRNLKEIKGRLYDLRGDGLFAWHLVPGEYAIGTIHWGLSYYAAVNAFFTVPASNKLVYMGSLQEEWKAQMRVYYKVSDDYDRDVEQFRAEFPEIQEEPVKSLIHFGP